MAAFDFFWTTWRSAKHRGGATHDEFWAARGGMTGRLDLAEDTTLDGALDEARRVGFFGQGTSQTGCYEVQGPRGVWTHRDGLRNLGRAQLDAVIYRSWEELEREDDREDDREQVAAACLFVLGTTVLPWLWQPAPAGIGGGPLMVNANVLDSRRTTYPRGSHGLYIDSAGFTEITRHGKHRRASEEYCAVVRRCRDELGTLVWASCQDWVCTPLGLAATGFTIAEHQRRTTDSYLALRLMEPSIDWVPVVQGQEPDHYAAHVAMYRDAGVVLEDQPALGVGSLVGRTEAEARRILEAIDHPALHGFGVKGKQLSETADLLVSADSLAWCYAARMDAKKARFAAASRQLAMSFSPPPRSAAEDGGSLIRSRAYAERWRAKQVAMAERARRGSSKPIQGLLAQLSQRAWE